MLNIITTGLLSRCIRMMSSLGIIKPYTNLDPRYRRYNIGAYTYGYPKILDWTQKIDLTIGRYCSFAAEVTIILDGEHILDRVSTYPPKLIDSSVDDTMHPATRGAVTLGNGVWIGFGAIILSGVKIGDGAVIGAGSVITRDIPPYGIAAGNPAKILKYRFDENTIEKIDASRWWEKEACRNLAEFVKQNASRATHEI